MDQPDNNKDGMNMLHPISMGCVSSTARNRLRPPGNPRAY
jgi:hypothetical protein